MRAFIFWAGLALFTSSISSAHAQHAYIELNENGDMVVSGPFNLVIPKPGIATAGEPEHSTPSFLNENLKISKAGLFAADQFIVVQVETTNAPAGTLTAENMPLMTLAGEEFRARMGCIEISQEELDRDDDPLFEYIEDYNVQIVPAVLAMQLLAVDSTGTAQATVLFMRNVPGDCQSLTEEFERDFVQDFERFIESVRAAN